MLFTSVLRMTSIPIVVVLGATGTGKSKLSIELAQRFGGEIISADSIQVYKGLDIVTNKVTKEELCMVKHHMIDFLDPLRNYSVVDYKRQALPVLENLVKQKTMPVIVGGTNYYIESLLWKVLIDSGPSHWESDKLVSESDMVWAKRSETETPSINGEDLPSFHSVYQPNLPEITDNQLHLRLQEVDPEMANQLHSKDRRKVLRALQIHEQLGRPQSEVIKEQKMLFGGLNEYGGPLRFDNVCCLWIDADQDVLDTRLDSRVDAMMQQGLIEELTDFHLSYNNSLLLNNKTADYTKGIFQTIGFKEFHEFLTLSTDQLTRSEKLLSQGVDLMKARTKRYSRGQQKWIRKRFLSSGLRMVPPVYKLDGTILEDWDKNVLNPALEIVSAYLNNTLELLSVQPEIAEPKPPADRTIIHCDICSKQLMGKDQADSHFNSKVHRTMKSKLKNIAMAND